MTILLTASVAAPSTDPPGAGTRPDLDIRYIGNEGFFVTSGTKKVLVDALYREGVANYAVISESLRRNIERAAEPFDDVDLILATHFHADHFDAAAVRSHLEHNSSALFVSTEQAVSRLRATGKEFEKLSSRVQAVVPEEGQREIVEHAGIRLEVLYLHHGRNRPIENLGFLIHLDGRKLLHVGDTEASADDLLKYALGEDRIDVAFVPFWYLMDKEGCDAVRQAIRSQQIVVMHLPPKGSGDDYIRRRGGWDAVVSSILEAFPEAVVFEREGETRKLGAEPARVRAP